MAATCSKASSTPALIIAIIRTALSKYSWSAICRPASNGFTSHQDRGFTSQQNQWLQPHRCRDLRPSTHVPVCELNRATTDKHAHALSHAQPWHRMAQHTHTPAPAWHSTPRPGPAPHSMARLQHSTSAHTRAHTCTHARCADRPGWRRRASSRSRSQQSQHAMSAVCGRRRPSPPVFRNVPRYL